MSTYFQCEYIGLSTVDGFVRGHVYVLQIFQGWFGSRLRVIPTHGYAYKPIYDYATTYNNLEHFLDNWKFIKFERENLWPVNQTTQQQD